MKKLVLTLAVALTIGAAAVSCGNNAGSAAKDIKAKIEHCSNPDSVKVYADEAREYARKLVAEGKVEEAKKYLAEIEPVVKEKVPALAGTFTTVNGLLDKVEDTAADKAADAKESASAAVDSAKSAAGSAVDAAKEKAGEVGDAAAQKASDLKQAVSDKASDVKDAASDAVQKGADKVKDLLN